MNYYNEVDPHAAAWLRELIRQDHIAPGEVDERSIEDVRPDDLEGFTQCHFFAGIGTWSYALRQAGWPDDRPVWTGSCPCQPFSAAGKGGGVDDERHLWPAQHYLIEQCRPPVWFGEQVASKDGLAWLDLVQTDLEGAGYACGAIDACAAGFGAPHLRQRQYIAAERLAHIQCERSQRGLPRRTDQEREVVDGRLRRDSSVGGMGNADSNGLKERGGATETSRQRNPDDTTGGDVRHRDPRPTNGFWGVADWLRCKDDKWRSVEPGTFPLVDGATARMVRLRGYGNGIVTQQATAFIEAYMVDIGHTMSHNVTHTIIGI